MLLHFAFRRLVRRGTLAVRWPDGRLRHYGDGRAQHAGLHIRTARAARRLPVNAGLALGEGYMEGEIEPLGGSIRDLLDFLTLNIAEGGTHAIDRLREHARRVTRMLGQVNPAPRARFAGNRDAIAAPDDERFCRMFDFYLAAVEQIFRHCGRMVRQVQLARRQDAVPLTRDYLDTAAVFT